MSLIQRKWLADQIINNAKVDHTDIFKIGGLRVDETTAVGGISVGTPNNYDAIHIRRDSSAAIRLEQTGGRTYQLNTLDGTYNVRDIGDSANRLIIKRFSPTVGRLGVNADDPQDEGHFRSTSAQAAIRLDLDDGASGRAYHIASNSSGNLVVKDIDADATRVTITSAGDLVVARDATVTGNFQVQGTVTVINHDIIVSEELQVDGPTTLRDATTSSGLYVGTDATVARNLHVVGDMLIDDITLDQVNMNDATVANRLVTNKLKVDGDASVIGTTQLEGGLVVKSTGNSTFETDVLMNGGLQVDGGTNLIGTLSVYGDATAYQKLLVAGDVSSASNVRCSTFDVVGAVGALNTDLLPAANGIYDLGAGSKWRDVRCVNAYGTHGYFDDATVDNRLVTNNLKVNGDASIIGTTQLEGGLLVKSTGNSTFETDVLMNGGLQVDGGTNLIGTLSVYGDATAYQKLLVAGDVSSGGDLYIRNIYGNGESSSRLGNSGSNSSNRFQSIHLLGGSAVGIEFVDQTGVGFFDYSPGAEHFRVLRYGSSIYRKYHVFSRSIDLLGISLVTYSFYIGDNNGGFFNIRIGGFDSSSSNSGMQRVSGDIYIAGAGIIQHAVVDASTGYFASKPVSISGGTSATGILDLQFGGADADCTVNNGVITFEFGIPGFLRMI